MNLKEEIKTLDLHAQIGDLKGVDKENKIVEIFRNNTSVNFYRKIKS